MTRGLEVIYTDKEQRSLIHQVEEWGHGRLSLVTGLCATKAQTL